MAPRETENNAYSHFWGDKQRALWYVMLFSGVVNISGDNCLISLASCKGIQDSLGFWIPHLDSRFWALDPDSNH